MGERHWYVRYRTARDYANEQAEAYRRGDEIENWAYETDYKPGMPEPRKVHLTGAAWVAHAYEIAPSDAATLAQVHGAQWQAVIDECKAWRKHTERKRGRANMPGTCRLSKFLDLAHIW